MPVATAGFECQAIVRKLASASFTCNGIPSKAKSASAASIIVRPRHVERSTLGCKPPLWSAWQSRLHGTRAWHLRTRGIITANVKDSKVSRSLFAAVASVKANW